jgi:hypothetical protein
VRLAEGVGDEVVSKAELRERPYTRKEVYRHSSVLRHKLSRQPRAEPRSAAEVLGPTRA